MGGAETFRDLSEIDALKRELEGRYHVGELTSRSPRMHRLFSVLPAIAASPSTVLITGETGTGKELLARTIHSLSTQAGKKKIVGNLPYNISTPLLFRLSEVADEVADMHFMLQKEVVERMVAAPKSNDYGRLSVMLQYFFDMELLLEVPPESFDPAPKVDSAVVRMIPDAGRIGVAQDFEHFGKLVKAAFHQRRKTIRNNLKDIATDEDLAAVGINPQDRAEHIAPELYVTLSNYLADKAA